MSESAAIRVVMAKPEAGGKGTPAPAKLVDAFREAGLDTVQAGDEQTAEALAAAVVREGADAICVTSLLGEHAEVFGGLLDALRERGAGHVVVFGGGIIPTADIEMLKERGVAEVFTMGTSPLAVAEWLRERVRQSSGV
jgi:methylmalonyl-CoA mutase C-terminal domain/subunit